MMTGNYDRQEMLGILNALGEDKLLKALAAAGIQLDGSSSLATDMALPDPVDELTPWNKTDVKVPLTTRPPIVDRMRTTELPAPPPMAAGGFMGDPSMDNLAPFAATAAG